MAGLQVNNFFCYDDTWEMVLSRLVRESDVVFNGSARLRRRGRAASGSEWTD